MNVLSIGIDFGTTKTLVAYIDENSGQPRCARLGRGSDYIPTTIYASEDGNFLFGEDADDEMHFDATRYCRGFKMKLGSSAPALLFFQGSEVISYTAKQLTFRFLKYVRERCEKNVFMGKAISRAIITYPVSFSPAQCEELKLAAELAGFSEIELIYEPQAAGVAFCSLCPKDSFRNNALIVDWGGGR